MVQGYYNLEEAAEMLGMSIDALSRMAQKREVRAFADKGSWKFRQQDIEELRRVRQLGSDPEIRLSDTMDRPPARKTIDSDEHVVFDESAFAAPVADDSQPTQIGLRGAPGTPGGTSDSDVRLVITGEVGGSDSDVRLVPDATTGKTGSSDEVPIAADLMRAPSDSDIRLAFADSAVPPARSLEGTDDLKLADLPVKGEEPSSSGSDTDFQVDEDLATGFKVADEPDINLADFDSDHDEPKKGSKDQTMALDDIQLEDSAFNLDRSGIPLKDEKKKGSIEDSDFTLAPEMTSDSEFELSLDSSEESDIFGTEELPGFKEEESDDKLGAKVKGPAPTKPKAPGKPQFEETSDSDFELAMDEEFDIEEEESGSEVVAIDEDRPAAPVRADDEVEDDDFSDDLTPVGRAARPRMSAIVETAAPAAWPGWLIPFLALNTILLAVVGMMMHELMRNAWSYNTPYTMNATIIDNLKNLVGF